MFMLNSRRNRTADRWSKGTPLPPAIKTREVRNLAPRALPHSVGAEIREPVLAMGPFIMNKRSQIEDAVARYRAGEWDT